MRRMTRVAFLWLGCGLFLMAVPWLARAQFEKLGRRSFLGVYGHAFESTSVDGKTTLYGPLFDIRVRVSVANEEGWQTLDLPEGVAGSLEVELVRNDLPVADLEIEWTDAEESYSFSGEAFEEGGYPTLLIPGQGRRAEVSLRKADGALFEEGDYVLHLRILPDKVRTAEGLAWQGDGGLGGGFFQVRAAETLEDRKHQLAIQGSVHLQRDELETALAIYTELQELDPTDPMLCSGRGHTLFRMRDYAGASACFERMLPALATVGKRWIIIPEMAAHAFVAQGKIAKAREAIALYTNESEVDTVLAEIQEWAVRENKQER